MFFGNEAMSCLQIQGLEKISKQLANEVPKIRKDLELANEKEEPWSDA